MKKLISIIFVAFFITIFYTSSYAGGDNSAGSLSISSSEGGDLTSKVKVDTGVHQEVKTKIKEENEVKQKTTVEDNKKSYSSVLAISTSPGKDESGINSFLGGVVDSEPSLGEKVTKKGNIVTLYNQAGILEEEKAKLEALKDMRTFKL